MQKQQKASSNEASSGTLLFKVKPFVHLERRWMQLGEPRAPLPSILPTTWLQVIAFTCRPRCKPLPDYIFRVKASGPLGPEDLERGPKHSTTSKNLPF